MSEVAVDPAPAVSRWNGRVLAVANNKGGVKKTSLVANAGGQLASGGFRVLIMALDTQEENLATDLGYIDRSDHGRSLAEALISGGTDAAIIREALTRAVNGVKDAVTVVGLVLSMLWLDWVLSAIAAALYPLAAVPIQRLGRRIRRASGGMQESMGETAALLHESFAQARTVRAYRLEAAEAVRAERAFAHLNGALLRMSRSRARLDPLLEVLGG